MEIKEVYEALEKAEGGADLISAIKSETAKLSNEAKKHRQNGDSAVAKIKSMCEALGVVDDDKVIENLTKMKTTLDTFAQSGKKPDEIAGQLATLTKNFDNVSKQLTEMTKRAEEEKTKRLGAVKTNALVEALTKANCLSPQNVAKIAMEFVKVGDDEAITMDYGDKQGLSVEDGVKAFLADNSWAVKAGGSNGGGAGTGEPPGNADPFLSGFSGK